MLDCRRGSEHSGFSFQAAIKKCGKAKQWSAALSIFREACQLRSKVSLGCHNAVVGACGKGKQWQRALALLSEMWEVKLEPNVIYSLMPGAARARRVSTLRPAAAQGASKTDPQRAREPPRQTRSAQDGPERPPSRLQRAPGRPKMGPRRPKFAQSYLKGVKTYQNPCIPTEPH